MTELLPCPFCGGAAVLCRPPLGRTYVCCDANFCSGPKNTDTEAIAAWNRRAPVWRPIATAPKDGTRVLLHSPATHTYTGIAAVWCLIQERWEEWGDHYPCNPTHWQPLPAPPKEPTNE